MKEDVKYLLTVYVVVFLVAVACLLSGCGHDEVYHAVKGDKGDVGEKGAQGEKGDKGDVGLQGLQGVQGIVGPQGIQGIVGPQGIQGLIGTAGIQGVPGAPGTLVSFVKFCNEVTNYPSTFPEYGLCVGGQLFAIYSANGGFGILTPPGAYSSNGINSSCNFVVHENCVITH